MQREGAPFRFVCRFAKGCGCVHDLAAFHVSLVLEGGSHSFHYHVSRLLVACIPSQTPDPTGSKDINRVPFCAFLIILKN